MSRLTLNSAPGKILTLLLLSLFTTTSLNAQTTFWAEDFETNGNGSRYAPEVEASPSATNASCNDYFARSRAVEGCTGDLIDIALNAYTGFNGAWLWAAEDLDDNGVGGSQNFELFINFDNIPSIAGKSNLAFSGRFGTGASSTFESPNAAATNPDFIVVEYQIDGAGYQELLAFYAQDYGVGFANSPLALDTNNDRFGDGDILTNNLETFIAPIPETGTTLDLRIRVSANSSSEEIAFDFFELIEGSTLPVTLGTFTGQASKESVQLRWTTETERDNYGFDLLKSTNSVDWETLTFLPGLDNTSESNSYFFQDDNPSAGVNYYRLRQLDYTGHVSYSSVIAVTFQPSKEALRVHPNPSAGTFKVAFAAPLYESAKVQVFNTLGVPVFTKVVARGTEDITVAIPTLGSYFVRFYLGNQVYTKKILIQR